MVMTGDGGPALSYHWAHWTRYATAYGKVHCRILACQGAAYWHLISLSLQLESKDLTSGVPSYQGSPCQALHPCMSLWWHLSAWCLQRPMAVLPLAHHGPSLTSCPSSRPQFIERLLRWSTNTTSVLLIPIVSPFKRPERDKEDSLAGYPVLHRSEQWWRWPWTQEHCTVIFFIYPHLKPLSCVKYP